MSQIMLNSISKSYGETRAVSDVSLTIADGEFVTLLGPSGCGKTTTLRMIAGFIAPDAGSITIGDQTVADATARVSVPPERRRLGMVFQSYAVWPHMTVYENIAYPLRVAKKPRPEIDARVTEVATLVKMPDLLARYPSQLSGGQQQRVALARAIVAEPRVLLLDEPLSNLDAKLRESMRLEIKELQQRLGITIIFVTHDQVEAMVLSDRIAVMDQGRIRQVGAPREIYERPADPFVARFIGAANLLPIETDGAGLHHAAGDPSFVLPGVAPATAEGSTTAQGAAVIRPEDLALLPPGEAPATAQGGAATAPAVVVETVWYMGDRVLCRVRRGERTLLVALDRKAAPAVGTEYRLEVRDCSFVREVPTETAPAAAEQASAPMGAPR